MKNIHLFLVMLLATMTVAGQDLNAYKYVIIPAEFDFLKEPNQHQLNELTKFLFEKEGFEVFMEEKGRGIPEVISANRCEALNARVIDNSGFFNTKLSIALFDCNNREVFVTEEGVSKEKDFKTGYHEALRKAFESISSLNYNYMPTVIVARPETARAEETDGDAKAKISFQPKIDPVVLNESDKIKTEEIILEKDNVSYVLKKTDKGYNFHHKDMAEPFASLIKSSGRNSYIYSSITSKGMAHFDENGNLVVEILTEDSNLENIVYKKKGQ